MTFLSMLQLQNIKCKILIKQLTKLYYKNLNKLFNLQYPQDMKFLQRILPKYQFSTAKDTCLKEVHVKNKGKIVSFAGYNLPVNYPKGIIKQHLHCRESASIFDVSHMGQVIIQGKDRMKLLQKSTVGSTIRKSKGDITECYLTLFLNENAGIIDDAIATVLQKQSIVRIVVNAGNKYIVMKHLQNVIKQNNYDVKIDLLEQNGQIAIQGPKSQSVLSTVFPKIDFQNVPFMSLIKGTFNNVQYTITRSGYTGQDGFQLTAKGSDIVRITEQFMKNPILQWAGLGSRDSLRLQAGLCLHGNDMTEKITPLQATLMWTVNKRKQGDLRQEFIGQKYLKQLQQDVKAKKKTIRKRVGFVVNEPGIIRQHCKVLTQDNKEVGQTSSGSFSPSLKKSIGMAYIDQSFAKQQTELFAVQRDKKHKIKIKKMPFVPSGYHKGWKQA